MLFGDLEDRCVLKGAPGVTLPIESNAADWGPGLGVDAVFNIEFLEFTLLEVGVDLDLVHSGND